MKKSLTFFVVLCCFFNTQLCCMKRKRPEHTGNSKRQKTKESKVQATTISNLPGDVLKQIFSFTRSVRNPVEIFKTLQSILSTNKKFRFVLIQQVESRFGKFDQFDPLFQHVALLSVYLFPYEKTEDLFPKVLLWLFRSRHFLCVNRLKNSRLAERINCLIQYILEKCPIKTPRGICKTVEEKLENVKDYCGNSLFHWLPFIDITQFFQANNIHLNLSDPHGLYQAVLDNDVQQVRHLLETKKISPNGILNNRGETPFAFYLKLMGTRAIRRNQILLLYLPFHLAVTNGNMEIVKILLKHPEIDINVKDIRFGKTPLHHAIEYEYFDIAELLINHSKVDIDSKDLYGNSLLHIDAPTSRSLKFVETLIENHPDRKSWVNKKNIVHELPLHKAALVGNLELVKKLVKAGSDINEPDNDGNTPLHMAYFAGFYTICDYLILSDADVKLTNNNYETCLHSAIENLNFLYKFSDEDTENDKQKFLLVIRRLLRSVDINAQNNEENTALILATKYDLNRGVELLLFEGCNVSPNLKNEEGKTALHYAAENNNQLIVKMLIKANANLNEQDSKGYTPLNLAIARGHEDLAGELINSGADVNIADDDGMTPLDNAMFFDPDSELLDLLEDYNAFLGSELNKTKESNQ